MSDQRLEALERRLDVLRSPVIMGPEPEDPVGLISDFDQDDWPEELRERAQRDQIPIPSAADRERYFARSHALYWRTGYEEFEKVTRTARAFVPGASRIYDFGGSTGRVFRHFVCQSENWEVWSSDFKYSAYRWNQRHMPIGVRCFLNGFAPALPIPDQHFDVITAFSVFTHIDELESPWLLELRRVLRPGGLLYLTVHDEHQWANMPPDLLPVLQRTDPSLGLDSPFPGERAAYTFNDESYYSCNVFHSQNYIRKEWGRFFDVLELRPLESEAQCAVLLTYGG